MLNWTLLCFASAVQFLLPCTLFAYKLSLFDPFFLAFFCFRFVAKAVLLSSVYLLQSECQNICISSKIFPAIVQYLIALASSGFDNSSIPLLMFSIGIYILPLISKLLSACCDIFVLCALSLIILFYICACCDTRCFKNVCFFWFVNVKALLGLSYVLFNIRHKIKFLCLCLCLRPRLRLLPVFFSHIFSRVKTLDLFPNFVTAK